MDFVIQLAKILGMACTTGLAVLGLMTEFRDERKQITKWGRRALAAIIVSGSLTILVFVLESARSSHTQKKEIARLAAEVKRQEETLKGVRDAIFQLERSRASLQGARVSMTIEFPETSPYIKSHHERYRDLYSRYRSAVLAGIHPFDQKHPDFTVFKTSDGKSVDHIMLFSTSKDFPNISFSIAANVTAKGVTHSLGSFNDAGKPTDLDFALYTGRADEMRLTYYPSRRAYVLHFIESPAFRDASGEVTSLLDLPGRTIVLGFLGYVADGGVAHQEVQLREVSFVHPLGIKCVVPDSEIQRTGKEYPSYSFYGTFAYQGN